MSLTVWVTCMNIVLTTINILIYRYVSLNTFQNNDENKCMNCKAEEYSK